MNTPLVLIVEDDERSRKLVRDVLQASGYLTAEADTAEEGIRLAHKHRPALILMDICLPGMDGVAAMTILRSDPQTRAIPAVAVTASVMPEDQHRMIAAGFRTFRSKPIRVQELLSVVREVVASPKSKIERDTEHGTDSGR